MAYCWYTTKKRTADSKTPCEECAHYDPRYSVEGMFYEACLRRVFEEILFEGATTKRACSKFIQKKE